MPAYTSIHVVYSERAWQGEGDLRVNWQLQWDEESLYVAASVRDDMHVQTRQDNQVHRGDSLELQFDTEMLADRGDDRLTADDFQIVFSPGDFVGVRPVAYRFRGNASGRILEAPGHQIDFAVMRMAEGYTLEAAIPWGDLALTPRPGLEIGLALNANDNDTPETARQELMLSNAPGRILTDPGSWGTLLLDQ